METKELEIIPGILEETPEKAEEKLKLVLPFAKTVHIDFIDGSFAPYKTFQDPSFFAKYRDKILLEVHLMVSDPLNYLEIFAKAGFKRFIGHLEKMPDQKEFIQKAKKFGEAGLALDLETSTQKIKVPLDDLSTILLLTVKAGKSGQQFEKKRLSDFVFLQKKAPDLILTADGGLNQETILQVKEKGAKHFVTTSFLFQNKNPQEKFLALQKLVSA